MIQRIQSIYFLAACILCVASLCLPVAHFVLPTGELLATMRCFSVTFLSDGAQSHSYWALFALLLLVATIIFSTIFLYRRRALQMRAACFGMILLVGWYALYGIFVYHCADILQASFRPHWSAGLPFAALVLLYLAFRGVWHDEQLVKSLDRLR